MSGKYGSQRDEVLDALAGNGWAMESDGDAQDYGVWFAYMTNDAQDVSVENPEFVSVFESLEFDFDLTVELSAALVGNWVLTTNSDGQVQIYPMRGLSEARYTFKQMQGSYAEWLVWREG